MHNNKRYQIWIGNYHLGQGYDPPAAPELIAVIWSCNFKLACYEYETQQRMGMIQWSKLEGKEDIHTYVNQYDPEKMINRWLGKYYESEADAWKSFNTSSNQLS